MMDPLGGGGGRLMCLSNNKIGTWLLEFCNAAFCQKEAHATAPLVHAMQSGD